MRAWSHLLFHLEPILCKRSTFFCLELPAGLRSAPKIFNAIADGLQWIAMERGGTNLDHFLDDFITTGHPRSNECSNNLVLLMDTCKILNLPLALSKLEGPSTCLVFLGIELDTLLLQLRLPYPKLMRLKRTLLTVNAPPKKSLSP